MRRVVLKPGREGPVRGGHPWIFSGAVASGLEGAEPGEPVAVHAAGGRFLAAGYANPRTAIAIRVLTLEEEAVDAALVARRLDEALALRRATLPPALDAYRVVNGEGDRLPGVVVDRYADFLVCQFLTAGAARLAPAVVDGLVERLGPRGVLERSEGAVRREEGLPGVRAVLAGEAPPPRIAVHEADAVFLVDVLHGQKTGFFLDQRESRARVRALARGRRVLNAFAYTGAFAIAAARGGARHVTSVDTSRPALALADEACAANGIDPAVCTTVVADVFDFLRETADGWDVIVLDPPPFVRRRRDREAGLRGYKDVNLHAFRRLAPGGWLVTASCSQHVAADAFRAVVAAAAADAGRVVTIVAEAGHPPDHPVLLAHPEGAYLKVLVVRA
ncbi:MAG TPA: class I SAM-dependent rRNA methyltransferase [Candidatus Binatia bacterium]|jgi:23S rRNA (cytosine1962-C5)-methyltransferase|nr:class I SAM-dependent rRNA methyltransferase [Candidatus Binatia bacterium]